MNNKILAAGTTRHIRIDKDALLAGDPAISIQEGDENYHAGKISITGKITLETSMTAPTIEGCNTIPGKANVTITTDGEITTDIEEAPQRGLMVRAAKLVGSESLRVATQAGPGARIEFRDTKGLYKGVIQPRDGDLAGLPKGAKLAVAGRNKTATWILTDEPQPQEEETPAPEPRTPLNAPMGTRFKFLGSGPDRRLSRDADGKRQLVCVDTGDVQWTEGVPTLIPLSSHTVKEQS